MEPLSATPGDTALPQPGLRERKKRLRLQRILSVARQLFLDRGFQDTTIQDIARDAGIGLGTLYLYARSKEDLLVLVFREKLLELIDTAFERIPADAAVVDQVLAFFSTHIAWHKEDPALARTVLKELSFPATPQRREDVRIILQATCEKLGELLARAQSRGGLPDALDPGATVSSIFALYLHALQGFLGGFHTEAEFARNLRGTLRLFLPEPPRHA